MHRSATSRIGLPALAVLTSTYSYPTLMEPETAFSPTLTLRYLASKKNSETLSRFNSGFKTSVGKALSLSHPVAPRTDLPAYTSDEVACHDSLENRIWVTYRDGVFDITDFVKIHPGGTFIEQAYGQAVDPFFEHFKAHRTMARNKVDDYLAKYRIGTLADYEEVDFDSYLNEPDRLSGETKKDLSVVYSEPYVAQPKRLPIDYYTPHDKFYVRNHAPVPALSSEAASKHRIDISVDHRPEGEEGGGGSDIVIDPFSPEHETITIAAAFQCTGNRIKELNDHKNTNFAQNSGSNYIGNALWTGLPLAGILAEVLKDSETERFDGWFGYNVEFEGLDGYISSVPLSHILDPSNKVMLATKMNGRDIPPDHGYPVRVLCPGFAGARHVKWLKSIRVIARESKSPWHKTMYRRSNRPIYGWSGPQTVVTSHSSGDTVDVAPGKKIRGLEGIAYVGFGKQIDEVKVSADKGKTWHKASLLDGPAGIDSKFAWKKWRVDDGLSLDACEFDTDGELVEIWCSAKSENGKWQPQMEDAWNADGYLNNSVFKVQVKVNRSASGGA